VRLTWPNINVQRCQAGSQITSSATALLQHEIQFLLPLKIVPPYTVLSATSSLTS